MLTPWVAISLVVIAMIVMLAIPKVEQKDALKIKNNYKA